MLRKIFYATKVSEKCSRQSSISNEMHKDGFIHLNTDVLTYNFV